MLIRITGGGRDKQSYAFGKDKCKVVLGRKPKPQDSDDEALAIDEPTASRTHLMIRLKKDRIYIKDLGSKNGTKVNDQPLESNSEVKVKSGAIIKIGQSERTIRVLLRVKSSSPSEESSSSSPSSENRSRQKKKDKNSKTRNSSQTQFSISESTMKMLKQMTADKKSKEERIRFLKLMGCKNIDQEWEEIQKYLKSQIIFNSASKKAAEELEKQFTLGRSNAEKKGLGKS